MQILVTGSTGFVGGSLCKELVERGHSVRAFHRESSNLRLLEGLPVEHVIGDLTRPETLQAACEGIEVVFHAAALLGGPEKPGQMYAVTVEGTRAVLQAARLPETGALNQPVLLDESHTWNYRSDYWPYGYAKYLAEMEVQKAVAEGQDIVIVNPSIVFGAGDIYRQTNSLVVQVARGKLPALAEGGANFVHILDVVDGHLAALERGQRGERYILGGENLTFVKAVDTIARITGGSVPRLILPVGIVKVLAGPAQMLQAFLDLPIAGNMLHMVGRYFYYDTRKAQSELGLTQPRRVEDAVSEAYEWFLQVGAIKKAK
jgi:dihydroflavonol-4-reductase